jgi:imidazolonepropionase-like amidohydrolase
VNPPPSILSVSLALRNITLHDGVSDKSVSDALVLINNGKVSYAGPKTGGPAYTAEREIDGGGGYVLPGLIDLHVHALAEEKALRSFIANGVTTVRDMASPVLNAVEWKMKERRGAPGLPRIFVSGPVVTCEGGYPASVWGSDVAVFVTGKYQTQEKVRKLLLSDLDVIKVGLEHELGPCLSETEVKAACDTAHAAGRRVTAHLTSEKDFELCLKAGVDEAAHIPAREIPDEMWKEAASKGMVILPTLHAHAGWSEEWKRRSAHPFGCQCLAGFKEGYQQALRNLEKFLSFGGRVAYGTDAGNPHMPYGVSVEEWKDLQKVGLSPLQCLKMATSDAAGILGASDKLGSLVQGKQADLALYTHDPLNSPQNFRTLQWTLKGGELIPSGELEFPPPFDLDFWIAQWETNQRREPRKEETEE